jgi:hypothetical protein
MTYAAGVADAARYDETDDLAALLTDALGPGPVATPASARHADDVASLVSALTARGWTSGRGGSVAVLTSGVKVPAGGPAVVVVLHDEPHAERAWPGWDERVVAEGYQGCARAGRWTWYVHPERAAALGPRLGGLPPSANLVSELVAWRSAALTRWADRADEESGRANKELKAELLTTADRLMQIETSMAWRLARGLRVVMPARVVRALNR